MVWCEANAVDDVFGLARNERLVGAIAAPPRPAEPDPWGLPLHQSEEHLAYLYLQRAAF